MLSALKSSLRALSETALVLLFSWLGRRKPTRKTKVLVVKPDRLGDLIVIAQFIQALVDRFGAENVTLVITPINRAPAALLFPRCPLVVIPFHLSLLQCREWLAPVRAVAEIEAEHAFFLRHYIRYPHTKAIWRAANARHKHWVKNAPGYDIDTAGNRSLMSGRGLSISTRPAPNESLEIHIARSVLAQVFGPDCQPRRPATPTIANPPATSTSGRAILFPFANLPIRDLPPAMAAGIVSHLARHHRLAVTICGTPQREKDLRQMLELATRADESPLHADLAVLTPASFEAFYGAIIDARVVISTDTGPAHIAILHDRPTVGILGGGQYGIFAPWSVSTRQLWVNHELPCYGCNWHCRFERPHCITDIPLPSICSAIDRVIAQT